MTISSFNSLSLDPPLVLFSIWRKAKSFVAWQQAKRYAINVLSENQECWNPHARHFERVRPGDYQPDLDFARCRMIGEPYFSVPAEMTGL